MNLPPATQPLTTKPRHWVIKIDLKKFKFMNFILLSPKRLIGAVTPTLYNIKSWIHLRKKYTIKLRKNSKNNTKTCEYLINKRLKRRREKWGSHRSNKFQNFQIAGRSIFRLGFSFFLFFSFFGVNFFLYKYFWFVLDYTVLNI